MLCNLSASSLILPHTSTKGLTLKIQLSRRNRGIKTGASQAGSAAFETAEPRRMLSAAVAHGVLSIEGTGRSDTIVLTMDSPRTMRVRVGDTESTFLKKSFGKIRITAGRGEDLVTVGSDASPITCPVSVTGGDG